MTVSSLRRRAELLLPGFAIGLAAGCMAGGLAALGGLPAGYVAATTTALGVPLALLGAGYNGLLAVGRIRLGGVAPAAGYWLLAFPLARTTHEILLDVMLGRAVGLADGLLPFLGYQALLSVGFAIGFVWLHEHLAPIWWVHVRHHNPVAQQYVEWYVRQAMPRRRAKSP